MRIDYVNAATGAVLKEFKSADRRNSYFWNFRN